MGAVDSSWTVKELQAECKRRGIGGYSRLNKANLIRTLNTEKHSDGLAATAATGAAGADKKERHGKPREPTLEELRAECKKRGMTGFSHLNKKELLRRMEDYKAPDNNSTGTTKARALSLARGRKVGRTFLRRGGAEKERRQRELRARMSGPLRSRAQERFDAGPSPQDTPGFLYVYYEPGSSGSGGDSSITEWKIGKTTLDPPERRMKQSAQNNRKEYKLRASWYVPWCGYVEKIIHLDLDDFNVVPGKEKEWEGGGREDGGTEWFRTDIGVIEARVKLVIRMVAAREADEAESLGVSAFCGMFRCGLPRRAGPRRRPDPQPVAA